ncbi:FmdE family protein [uncultured Methanobrevibacter sp.]|uniref:FmdE family protein n=1 Tax=uncultured Methanobrevibacter sp. TaxID=253161 RepID=UPI0026067BF4|nr:FmdE family protein [uncultured Methanobrevibacter sp.]
MKKHGIVIITFLILTMSFISAVSASDATDLADGDLSADVESQLSVNQENAQINVDDELLSNDNGVSVNSKGNDNSYSKFIDSNLADDSNYKLGYNVTSAADKLLDFDSADDILVITTAGLTRINNITTENVLNGIIDASNGHVTYGKGNLLTLSAIRTDPTNIAFIIKKSNTLTMAFYKNGALTPLYYGTAGPEISDKEWKKIQQLLGNEDAYSYVSIANSWANGISKDILTQATYHGHVCTGLISGQAMIQTLLKYYPPRGESGLPLENTAYYVLGIPGDSDDDAFTWTMDITPGKRAYIGVDTMVDKSMTGFIRWNSQTKTGLIIVMSYNETKIKQTFKAKTGLNPDASATNDLKYQNWLIQTLVDNPTSLVDVLYEFDGLTQDDIYYLMGEEPGKGSVTKSAHGLDMDYILNLSLKKANREEQSVKPQTKLTSEQLKQIGSDASKMALNYFKSQGIDVPKDYPTMYVLTSASYVRINGTSTEMVLDGITDVFGSRLSKKTLLPVHTALWKDLVFDFFWVNSTNNKDTLSYSLKYDVTTGSLIETANTTANANYVIQSAIKYDPPYDVLVGWLFHNHVCGGSAPGYLIADFVYEQLPITNENESFIYITTNDNCKDDVISRLLGVSPGMENYYNLRYDDSRTNSTNVGIAIKWNSATKTGDLIIINLENWSSGVAFKKGSDMYEEYIRLYKHDYSSENLIAPPSISVTARKEINEDMLQTIVSGATDTEQGNSISYIMSLDDKLPVTPKPQDNTNNNKNTGEKGKGNQALVNGTTDVQRPDSGNGVSKSISRGSYSVGTTVNAAAASVASEADDASEDDSDDGASQSDSKSYEISEKPAAKDSSSNTIILAIAAVLIVGAIFGYGYIKRE